MENNKKTILVTGGTGYIGSHTTVELIEQNYQVVIVDNLSNSNVQVLDAIHEITGVKPSFFQVDLKDAKQTDSLFDQINHIDGVIHFAAYKAVGESVENPLKYYENNIMSLINVVNNMIKHNISNLVFSSSCTVYGQPDVLPVKETDPVKPALSPYGNTKQICEEIIQDVVKIAPMKSILLRYFNPIGAHHSAKIGELPIGVPNNLVPYITQTAIGIRPCLNVFGNDYNTPDGTCIRDFIHVVDIAKAHVVALNRMLDNNSTEKCEIFNLGTGKGYTILETIRCFEKVSGVKLNYKLVGRRAGDIEKVWADTSYANEILGWKALLELEDMLLSAWNWQKYLATRNQN